MADAVVRDRNRVMSVSTFLDGEYGLSDLAIGVPCVLGKNGVERILELKLDADAKREFETSSSMLKDVITKMDR